jgi:hypothetical protein
MVIKMSASLLLLSMCVVFHLLSVTAGEAKAAATNSDESGQVQSLTAATFSAFVGENPIAMVEFYGSHTITSHHMT